MDASQFVYPLETIKIEYYDNVDQYVLTRETEHSKTQRKVVAAGNLLVGLREFLLDDAVWAEFRESQDDVEQGMGEGAQDNPVATRDLAAEIDRLRLEVDALRARLSAVERPGPLPNSPYPLPWTPPYSGPLDGPYYYDSTKKEGGYEYTASYDHDVQGE